MKGGEKMTDEEILNARPGKKMSKSIPFTVKPGAKKKPTPKYKELTPKEDEFVQKYIETGNAVVAKRESEIRTRLSANDLLMKRNITEAIEERRNEMWNRFMEHAEEALQTQIMIMRNERASFKVRLDAASSVLDRAGFKPAERKEITGANGGAVKFEDSAATELAQRARSLLAEKVNIIDI